MRVSRLIRYAWLLELEPAQLEAIVRMLAEAEIQALKRAIREMLRENRDKRLEAALAELEELEELGAA